MYINDLGYFLNHFYHLIAARPKSRRIRRLPARFRQYWDMRIPTEYYQQEFIHFENLMEVLGDTKQSTAENLHAGGDHMLEMFKYYEIVSRNEEHGKVTEVSRVMY